MASPSPSPLDRRLAGVLIALAVVTGCATTPQDRDASKLPTGLPVQVRAEAARLADPWAPKQPERPSVFSADWWRSLGFTRSEPPSQEPPFARLGDFDVMRVRNPSDVSLINTPPETVMWTGGRPFTFDRKQVQWQKPPAPPPPPPKPAPPPVAEAPPVVVAGPQSVSRTIQFAFDRATLSADAKQVLDSLPTDNVMQATVEAHTDAVGRDPYNLRLSERRGKAVADYLVKRGFPAERLQVVAKGEAQPVADNKSPSGRAKNRRAEVVVTVELKP
jgi:outer membrane protein OmpA-like peptidoglycan-associated protein